jgi:hypothetical protein
MLLFFRIEPFESMVARLAFVAHGLFSRIGREAALFTAVIAAAVASAEQSWADL